MPSVSFTMNRDKETKNYVKFKLENKEHIEDFEKGLYIHKDSPLANAKVLRITLEEIDA
jgi:hypothetical protein